MAPPPARGLMPMVFSAAQNACQLGTLAIAEWIGGGPSPILPILPVECDAGSL